MQTVLEKLSSPRKEDQDKAVRDLMEMKSEAALSLAEFLVTGETKVPGHPVSFRQDLNESQIYIPHTVTDYVIYNYGKLLSVPGFNASFKRVNAHYAEQFLQRKLFKSLEGCRVPQCLELFDLAMKSKDPLARASAYLMLRNFDLKSGRIMSLIQTGLQSVHHGEKADAAYALLGRKTPEVIPLAQLALQSLFALTRIYGIGALAEIQDPMVFRLYREGLKDADPLVRYFTIFALGRRSEPAARYLLEQVQIRNPDLYPRTTYDQDQLAPLKERMAERLRLAKDQFDWMNSYSAGSPHLNMTTAFTTQFRKPLDFISRWREQNQTEADLAKQVLKNANFVDPFLFAYEDNRTILQDSNLIGFSGSSLRCSSIHSE